MMPSVFYKFTGRSSAGLVQWNSCFGSEGTATSLTFRCQNVFLCNYWTSRCSHGRQRHLWHRTPESVDSLFEAHGGSNELNMFVFMCENDYCSSAVGCINHRNIQLTEWNWKYNRMCTITEGLYCISFFHCVPVHVSSTLLTQEQSALLFSPAVTSTFRRFTWRPEPNLTDRCWKQQELTRVLLYMKKQSASLACCLAHIQHPAF